MSTRAIVWMPSRIAHYGHARRVRLVTALVRSAIAPELRNRQIVIHPSTRRKALRSAGAEVALKVTIR